MPRRSTKQDIGVELRRTELDKLLRRHPDKRQSHWAAHFDVHPSLISKDIKAIRKEWQKIRLDSFEERLAQQLAGIQHAKSVAWEQFEQTEDVRFLNQVMDCIKEENRVLGVHAATRVEATGKDGGPIETKAQVVVYIPDNGRDRENGDSTPTEAG